MYVCDYICIYIDMDIYLYTCFSTLNDYFSLGKEKSMKSIKQWDMDQEKVKATHIATSDEYP